MKRYLLRLLMMMVFLLVLGLIPGFAAAEDTNAAQDALQAYLRVLDGSEPYYPYDSYGITICDPQTDVFSEAIMTDEITDWYGFMFTQALHNEAFAITDLDADGIPELLLKLSNDFGFELLRVYDSKVYGYPFVYRGMETVTLDGEIQAASGAGNFGWYRLSFDGAQIQSAEICWTDDTAEGGPQFTIGGGLATEAEFRQMNETLWAKPTVAFIELTEEALAAAVAEY